MAPQDAVDPRRTVDRQRTTPFLLKLFYRTGGFIRPDEFRPNALPAQHLQIYTWRTCTLRELCELLFHALPSAFPSPAAGTRVAFRLLYPDPRAADRGGAVGGPPARYLTKELGSVVIRGKGAEEGQAEGEGAGDAGAEVEGRTVQGLGELEGEPEKMLMDARFVIGDHVCVGIFPGTTDGLPGVLPPREALLGGAGPGAGYGPREGGSNGFRDGRGAERGGGRFGGQGTSGSYRGRGFNGLDARGPPIPAGEWSRGERLPEERRRHGGGGGGGGYPSGPFRNGDRESR